MTLTLRTVFVIICAALLSAGQSTTAPASAAQTGTPSQSISQNKSGAQTGAGETVTTTTPPTPPPATVPPVSAPAANVPSEQQGAQSQQPVPASPAGEPPSVPAAKEAAQAKPSAPIAKGRKGKTETAVPAEDPHAGPKPYVIGPMDVIEVKVWGNTQLSSFYAVGTDGTLSMPLIGTFKADGLTAGELNAVIAKKLNETVMQDPEVTVGVAKINSKKYFIYGGCARTGEFPLIGEMTILEAFSNCGGFKEFSNTKKIYILRDDIKRIPFNFKDVSQGKHMEQNIHLQNGDKIFVPE